MSLAAGWHAKPKKYQKSKNPKNNCTQKTLPKMKNQKISKTKKNIKIKKFQPAAGDMPDIIQAEHVPSSWLARQKKIKKSVKIKKTENTQKITNKKTPKSVSQLLSAG